METLAFDVVIEVGPWRQAAEPESLVFLRGTERNGSHQGERSRREKLEALQGNHTYSFWEFCSESLLLGNLEQAEFIMVSWY